jgi:hypothetical protein
MKHLKARIGLAVLSSIATLGVFFGAVLIHLERSEFQARLDAMRREFAKPIIATEESTWCEIHAVFLKEDLVPIHYGLPGIPYGYLEARSNRFPHANDHYPGAVG